MHIEQFAQAIADIVGTQTSVFYNRLPEMPDMCIGIFEEPYKQTAPGVLDAVTHLYRVRFRGKTSACLQTVKDVLAAIEYDSNGDPRDWFHSWAYKIVQRPRFIEDASKDVTISVYDFLIIFRTEK